MSYKYTIRTDCLIDFNIKHNLSVNKVYNKGFDVGLNDKIVFFTWEQHLLHRLAVLTSNSIADKITVHMPVVFKDNVICIGDIALEKKLDIIPVNKGNGINLSCLQVLKNIKLLKKTLNLFAKNSIAQISYFYMQEEYENCKTVTLTANDMNSLAYIKNGLFNNNLRLNDINTLSMIGKGGGLTPSFDDFLAGIIFADKFYKFNRIKNCYKFIELIKSKTTVQAYWQYVFAESGTLNSGFEYFLKNFSLKKISVADIVKMLNYGYSSGGDILYGILFALSSYLTKLNSVMS